MLAPGKIRAQRGVICLAIDWLEERSAETPGKAMNRWTTLPELELFPLKERNAGESVMKEV